MWTLWRSAKIAAVSTSGRCRYFELSSVGTHCSQPPDDCSTQSMLIFYPNISSIVIVLNENTVWYIVHVQNYKLGYHFASIYDIWADILKDVLSQ